jgi:5-methylcytosine-specific restriction endonuclease McrA
MPDDTHSVPILERLPLIHDRTLTLLCPACGDTMKHFRTIAKHGVRPEQFMFLCPSCKAVDTKESKRRREGASVGASSIQ